MGERVREGRRGEEGSEDRVGVREGGRSEERREGGRETERRDGESVNE